MSFSKALMMAAAAYFAVGANGHMKMLTPAPFGADSLNNSPLVGDGSDFPCKQRAGVYDAPAEANTMAIGQKQTLSFLGGATHGGGSCQISLTSDEKPTKDSDWKVIHSIIGGCPNAEAGNIGDDAGAKDPTTFDYAIPDGITPGKYTLAWTWFNKVGNREMYMNCAPITVTGGKKRSVDDSVLSSPEEHEPSYNETAEFELLTRDATFPKMFVANIPTSSCTTVDSQDVQFPDPGVSVQKAGVSAPVAPTGPECGGSSGSASGDTPSAASSGATSAGDASGAASIAGQQKSPSTVPSAAAEAGAAIQPSTATVLAEPTAVAVPAAAADSGSTGSTACSGSAMTCSADGSQFGLCSNGQVVYQPVAAGTKCSNGAIVKRSPKFAKAFNA